MTFECIFQIINSPSADPEATSSILFMFLAIAVTPSEWSSSAFKNGLANTFSSLAAFNAH